MIYHAIFISSKINECDLKCEVASQHPYIIIIIVIIHN